MAGVVCQRPGHARSKVVRDGRYGTPGHKRQQYRCTPSNGDPSHRFTPVLPRLCVRGGERCLDCEHVIDRDEGPQVPRTYWYSSRDIAEALRAVGTGMNYIEAADSARKQARRTWHKPRPHGQLVADWTEVYAPVLWETFRPTRLPERLICDSTPFKVTPTAVRRRYKGRRPPRGFSVTAFEECCVVGADPPSYRPELLALVAVPVVDQAAWELVLRQLPPGQPLSVISDEDNSLANAVGAVWPTDPGAWRHPRYSSARGTSRVATARNARPSCSARTWTTRCGQSSKRRSRQSRPGTTFARWPGSTVEYVPISGYGDSNVGLAWLTNLPSRLVRCRARTAPWRSNCAGYAVAGPHAAGVIGTPSARTGCFVSTYFIAAALMTRVSTRS